jgi:Fe-S cluster assembly protein SufD
MEVHASADIHEPVEIIWLLRAAEQPLATTQRLLVLAGENSLATVVEHFMTLEGAQPSFTNGLTELKLEAGAKLSHYRLHEESGEALHIGGVHAALARDAQLDSFHLAFGSRLKRLDLVINHRGPGAHCNLNGVYLPRGEEHIDYHTTIEHAVPHCSTDEVFRGIVADSASAVFNGRIHIHPDAQKTRAELSNKNLLTSNEAEVNTKPELEIYADDVQCAHGATVAQLDALSLHYLRTRGVSRAEAEVMLSFGFINELIDAIALEPLRAYLRPLLASRFARSADLARHLL